MERKINVLILSPWVPTKKSPMAGIFILNQANELARFANVTIVNCRRGLFRKVKTTKFKSVEIVTLVDFFLPNSSERRLSNWVNIFVRFLEEYTNQKHIDLVHCHDYITIYAGLKLKNVYGIPFVATIHNTDFLNKSISEWRRPYLKTSMKECSAVISVGESLTQSLLEYADKSKIKTIPNIIDTDLFKYNRPKVKRPFRFLFVGNYEDRKGVVTLLKAFSLLDDKETELTCIGYGELKSKMLNIVKKEKMESRVKILNPVANEKLPEHYQKHHCYVSISKTETFGITVVEAMSCGMHILYSKSGGPEHLVPDVGSLLVDHVTPSGLCQKMNEMLRYYDESNSEKIRAHAVENYSSSIVTAKIIDVYKAVIMKTSS